jgi:hypothetical protein
MPTKDSPFQLFWINLNGALVVLGEKEAGWGEARDAWADIAWNLKLTPESAAQDIRTTRARAAVAKEQRP